MPLVAGDSEIDQLYKTFQVFGTPDNRTWAGVTSHRHYNSVFPHWQMQDLRQLLPRANDVQLELIKALCCLPPDDRIRPGDAKCWQMFQPNRRRAVGESSGGPIRSAGISLRANRGSKRTMGRKTHSEMFSVTTTPPEPLSAAKPPVSSRSTARPDDNNSGDRTAHSTFMGGKEAREAVQERAHGLLQRSMSTVNFRPQNFY